MHTTEPTYTTSEIITMVDDLDRVGMGELVWLINSEKKRYSLKQLYLIQSMITYRYNCIQQSEINAMYRE
jgi:hypothetical protein